MKLKFLFFFAIVFFAEISVSQSVLNEFKSFEKRVKYFHPDSIFYFAEQVDTLSVEGRCIKLWAQGIGNYWNSDYPAAYIKLEQAADLIENTGNHLWLGEIYLDLSSALAVMDKQGLAMSYLLRSNQIFKTYGNKNQQARASISLGELYRKIGEYENAMRVLRRSLVSTDSMTYNRARCLNRMAAVFSETGQLDSSLYYSNQSLKISRFIGDPDLIATSENEIGYALRQRDQFDKALIHFFKADSLWRSAGMYRYATNPLHHIAVVYRSIGQFDKALEITREACRLVKDKGWYQIEMNLMEDMKMNHFHLNNNDSMLFYDRERLEAALQFRGKQHEVNTKMVEILFTQKENEQTIREQEIKLKNEVLEKEAISRERTALWIIVSLIVMILLIIFIYAFNQHRLQKKLAIENEEKEKKNEQLLSALGTNEALVQEISHRVKNNLAVLAGLLTMQANRSDSDKVKKELKDSVLRIDSIATIHKKLYDKRNDARVNLKDAIYELSRNVVSALGHDPDEVLELSIDEIEIDIAQAVTLCLIINEALTNSCKYANVGTESKVGISLRKNDASLRVEVYDHGPGFDEKEITSQSRSLGVYLIRLLTKQLRADLSWSRTDRAFIMCLEFKENE